MAGGIGREIAELAIKLGGAAAMGVAAFALSGWAGLHQPPAGAKPSKAVTAKAQAAPFTPPAAPPAAPLSPAGQGYLIKGVLKIDGRLDHGDYAWNDEGIPKGEILITVDLKAQLLSIFRDGHEIGVAAILYGADDKPTPLGTFPVLEKDADHVSNLYDAPMPYMLRLTNDGIAIHGSEVEWGYGTHGCIGVPVAFAKLLYEQVKLGDRVIITNGEELKVGDSVTRPS